MFACWLQPDLKATFDVRVTRAAHWKVISNGAPLAAANVFLHLSPTTPRMSTYLVATRQVHTPGWMTPIDDRGKSHSASIAGPRLPGSDAERLFTPNQAGIRLLPQAC
ncbi:hypothetical protein ABLN97_01800 [Mycobacterium tuberculosis]